MSREPMEAPTEPIKPIEGVKVRKRKMHKSIDSEHTIAESVDLDLGESPKPFDMERFASEVYREESRVDHVYLDSLGHKTAGIGHLLTDSDPEFLLPKGTPVDPEKVTQWFADDLDIALEAARKIVNGFDEMPLDARLVIANMSFQLGASRQC